MRKVFTKKGITAPGLRRTVQNRADEMVYGDTVINQRWDPIKRNLATAATVLSTRKIISSPERDLTTAPQQQMTATSILFAMGCSISTERKNYSFLTTAYESLLKDPNITMELKSRPSPLSPIKRYPEAADPFYDPDSQFTVTQEAAIRKEKILNNPSDVVSLVADVVELNMYVKEAPTLKQFKPVYKGL